MDTQNDHKRKRDEEPPFYAARAAVAVCDAKEDPLAALRALRRIESRRGDFRAFLKGIEPHLGERFRTMSLADVGDLSIVCLARYCSEGNPQAAAKAAALLALAAMAFLTDNGIPTPADIVFVSQPLCRTFSLPGGHMYNSLANVRDDLLAAIMTAQSPVPADVAFKKRVARERLRRRKALDAALRAIFALTGADVTDDQVHSEQIVDLAGTLHPDDVSGLCLAIVRAILDVRSFIQQLAPCTTATQLTEKVNERTIGELCNLRVGDCTAYTDTAETESDSDSD